MTTIQRIIAKSPDCSSETLGGIETSATLSDIGRRAIKIVKRMGVYRQEGVTIEDPTEEEIAVEAREMKALDGICGAALKLRE